MSVTTHPRTYSVRPLMRSARRQGAILLIVAFALVVVSIPLVMFGSPERFLAEESVAADLGVDLRGIPGDVYSQIVRAHSSIGFEVVTTLPPIAALVLFAIGVFRLTGGGGALATAARATATLTVAAFVADMLLFYGLYAGPETLPWMHEHFTTLNVALVAVSVMSGCVAVFALALRLRRQGAVRVVGIVVGVLAVLGFVAAPIPAVGGMPPAYPLLLALVLAVGLLRKPRQAASTIV